MPPSMEMCYMLSHQFRSIDNSITPDTPVEHPIDIKFRLVGIFDIDIRAQLYKK